MMEIEGLNLHLSIVWRHPRMLEILLSSELFSAGINAQENEE